MARRGARRIADVPPFVLSRLHAGEASVNHVEQMAMDMTLLWSGLFPELAHRGSPLAAPRFLDRMRAGGQLLWEVFGEACFDLADSWESDTARGWAPFAVPMARSTTPARLDLVMRFADDPHFAVREWAWLAVRPTVAADLGPAIDYLSLSAGNESPLVRRFSCEVLRPRGVWSAHIAVLKADPAMALPVLDQLVSDPDRYVQDSVGNWLNDAYKTRPGWVLQHSDRWSRAYGDAFAYVRRRALRGHRPGSR